MLNTINEVGINPKTAIIGNQIEEDFIMFFLVLNSDTLILDAILWTRKELKTHQIIIIIAKPSNSFNNLDKFLIDQYIMNGGKVLWLIDGVSADMDKLRDNPVSLLNFFIKSIFLKVFLGTIWMF